MSAHEARRRERALDGAAGDGGAGYCDWLARALLGARANKSWPDLRSASGFVAAASPALHQGAGPRVVVDETTGLLPYEIWARLAADRTVTWEAAAPLGAPGTGARAYRDALRALPPARLGDVDVAVRNDADKRVRRVHVTFDKVEGDGQLVRLAADVALAKGSALDDDALDALDAPPAGGGAAAKRHPKLRKLLLPMAALPAELTLVQLLAAGGVVDVERVTRGAVDVCNYPDAGVAVLGDLISQHAVLGLSFTTCALDVAGGDDDPLPHESTPLAELAREHLGTRDGALPHRVFRERKLVTSSSSQAQVRAFVAAARKRSVVYSLADGGAR